MHFSTTVVLAIAAAPFATAQSGGTAPPSARVVNRCSFPVTMWSVGSSLSGGFTLGANGGSYGEQFSRDPVTGGRTLKVTRDSDGLFTGKPQLNFAYNLDGSQVWYDLSSVFGNALAGSKVVVSSAEASCPAIVWSSGTPPSGSQVKVCTSSKDVTLTLCAP
ncbi:hypothetical protein MCOR27_004090 [Pyricularia oryzae]|uniref:Bys1 family protein n=5 Tax=Pyricularia TaxID=48558 RepID=A0ABQ8NN78_PYRGI|nr:Bys1 family protein [Pyricularia oryzae 70-15]ELQ44890.1 Bys1 family protein [Pyricularia oryzae Y34]KAH8843585.1 hypothetical protein MCOR01_004379 [Pyricularia oryzae]KAI6299666.1 hypothetical protein MCOR33_004474 [Pyricularia grisea]EHA50684.1 Bys1 family protein [Pyricularia oryzae 70-15]KAH9431061.1 hypothetical protein MCOR02_008370 [Pyricularia oryzae]